MFSLAEGCVVIQQYSVPGNDSPLDRVCLWDDDLPVIHAEMVSRSMIGLLLPRVIPLFSVKYSDWLDVVLRMVRKSAVRRRKMGEEWIYCIPLTRWGLSPPGSSARWEKASEKGKKCGCSEGWGVRWGGLLGEHRHLFGCVLIFYERDYNVDDWG